MAGASLRRSISGPKALAIAGPAIHGAPENCRARLLRAQKAGLELVMFTVSLASNPLETVALFGREVCSPRSIDLRHLAASYRVQPAVGAGADYAPAAKPALTTGPARR